MQLCTSFHIIVWCGFGTEERKQILGNHFDCICMIFSGAVLFFCILQVLNSYEWHSKMWWRSLQVSSSMERPQTSHWAWGTATLSILLNLKHKIRSTGCLRCIMSFVCLLVVSTVFRLKPCRPKSRTSARSKVTWKRCGRRNVSVTLPGKDVSEPLA